MIKAILFAIMMCLISMNAHAELYYNTYMGPGAYPNTPFYGTGTLDYPTVLSTGTVTSINHNWGGGNVLDSGRSERVIVKYWGYLYVPGSGSQTLTFNNYSDDGFYMKINDTVVINDWQEQGPSYYNGSGSITLTGGQYYAIEVWYYENGGGAASVLYWNQSGSTAVVPTSSYALTVPGASSLCCGGSASSFSANAGHTNLMNAFDSRTSNDSKVYVDQIGNQNTIVVNQSGTQHNYVNYEGNGSSNDINITQSGNSSTVANYVDLNVIGDQNDITITQQSTGGRKGIFATVSNNNNDVSIVQKDAGSHYVDLTLTGGNKTVDILQQGNAGHMASISLTGQPTALTLSQSGSSGQNFYSLQFNCGTSGGCAAITVEQTK